jgi:uncharacterized membrane protein
MYLCVDVGATTPQQMIDSLIIGVAAGWTILVVIIAIFVVIMVVVVCYCQRKQQKLKQQRRDDVVCERLTSIKDKVDDLDCSDKDRIDSILDKLKDVQNYIRTASDSPSGDTEQLDLVGIEHAVEHLVSKLKKK